MAKEAGSEGTTRKSTIEWAADTNTYLQGHTLLDTDTGEERTSKGRAGNTWATAWRRSTGGGDYSPPIPQGDVTGLETALSDIDTDITNIQAQSARDRHPVVTFSTNTNTAQDPGQATIRFNNGTIASVTEIALSDADSESIDKGDLNSRCAGIIQLRTVASAATIEFLITGIVHTSFTRYTVTYLKGSLPTNGTAMTYRFLPTNAATPAVTTALAGKADAVPTYVALLSQSATDAPIATVLENTLGGSVVWTYSGPGAYFGTLSGAFPTAKTAISTGGRVASSSTQGEAQCHRWDDNSVRVISYDTIDGAGYDDQLDGFCVTIKVYP